MKVMIGVDPHKATHTAVALDGDEVELARLQVRTNTSQLKRLRSFHSVRRILTLSLKMRQAATFLRTQQSSTGTWSWVVML